MTGQAHLHGTATRRSRNGSRHRTGEVQLLAPVTQLGPDHAGMTDLVQDHLDALAPTLRSLQDSSAQLASWGVRLAEKLVAGHRLLAAGNGGSAAEAQHLTAELVGRFDGEREAFSAIALHAETSAITAISNDYGYEYSFARQVRGHGRPGDVLVLFSTSGRSPNLVRAVEAAREVGLHTWSLTGPAPNPLAAATDENVAVDGPSANVQECHLVALHAVCRAFDATVAQLRREQEGAEERTAPNGHRLNGYGPVEEYGLREEEA